MDLVTDEEQRERTVSGLVYNLWGQDDTEPWAKLPDMLFDEPEDRWWTFVDTLVAVAGGDGEDELRETLFALDQYIADDLVWLAAEDADADGPQSPALWLAEQLVEMSSQTPD